MLFRGDFGIRVTRSRELGH